METFLTNSNDNFILGESERHFEPRSISEVADFLPEERTLAPSETFERIPARFQQHSENFRVVLPTVGLVTQQGDLKQQQQQQQQDNLQQKQPLPLHIFLSD